MITNDARCIREIKARTATAKAVYKKDGCFHQQIGLRFKEESSEMVRLERSVV